MIVQLTISGNRHAMDIEPRVTLLDALRDHAGLTGTHAGCEQGVCGACTVNFDGQAVRSCLMFACMAQGHVITTVEGYVDEDGTPGDVQQAFWDNHALQCGYCTPGMVVAVETLLSHQPEPSDAQIRSALSGNLCRCTGYQQIVEAVVDVAERRRTGGAGR